MNTTMRIILFFILSLSTFALEAQNCGNLFASGSILVDTSNSLLRDGTYFIEQDMPYSANFVGTTNGGVLNYVVHFDSILYNSYSILNTNINNGTFTDYFPNCESYYISAVYGFDTNLDGVVDDFFDPCNFVFTSSPLEFYFPIQVFFPVINAESCFNLETEIEFFINGGITDCLADGVCASTYVINGVQNYCSNELYTFYDPITGDSIYDIGQTDTLLFSILDTDGKVIDIIRTTSEHIIYICPVELIDFNATFSDDAISIDWQTAAELNNDFFSIQKSIDGRNFENIAHVKGSGTTSKQNNYTFQDTDLNSELMYYKLIDTDLDGNEREIAQTVVSLLDLNMTPTEVYMYSNRLYINAPEATNFEIELYDINGKFVFKKNMRINSETLDFNSFDDGHYILKIESSNFNSNKKVVIN